MQLKRLHWFKFTPSAFTGDTKVSALTPAEVGAYIRILCAMWEWNQNKEEWQGLPNRDKTLRAAARMSPQQWRRARESLFDPEHGVLTMKRGMVTNRFMETQFDEAVRKTRALSKSAKSRWDKDANADADAMTGTGTGTGTDSEVKKTSSSSSRGGKSPPQDKAEKPAPVLDLEGAWPPGDLTEIKKHLDETEAPAEFYSVKYWKRMLAWLKDHPKIAILNELDKYLAWEETQPNRKRNLGRGFRNWLAKAEFYERNNAQRQEYRQRKY